jgi:hypothetical protein
MAEMERQRPRWNGGGGRTAMVTKGKRWRRKDAVGEKSGGGGEERRWGRRAAALEKSGGAGEERRRWRRAAALEKGAAVRGGRSVVREKVRRCVARGPGCGEERRW